MTTPTTTLPRLTILIFLLVGITAFVGGVGCRNRVPVSPAIKRATQLLEEWGYIASREAPTVENEIDDQMKLWARIHGTNPLSPIRPSLIGFAKIQGEVLRQKYEPQLHKAAKQILDEVDITSVIFKVHCEGLRMEFEGKPLTKRDYALLVAKEVATELIEGRLPKPPPEKGIKEIVDALSKIADDLRVEPTDKSAQRAYLDSICATPEFLFLLKEGA